MSFIKAQNTSSLYNSQGALIAQPNFQIDQEALQKWSEHEDYILWRIASDFKFSDFAKDQGLDGSSLLKISVFKNGESEIEKLRIAGGGLEEIVILSFEKHNLSELLKPDIGDSLLYYLPIAFKLENLKTESDSTGRLILKETYFPHIQH